LTLGAASDGNLWFIDGDKNDDELRVKSAGCWTLFNTLGRCHSVRTRTIAVAR
jgi:hypothetical protein